MRNHPLSRLFSLLLALSLAASLVSPAWASEGETVTISSREDLLAFAKHCALDTWSQGKTVVLTEDVDLGEEEFNPIPTFGGTFLGQGHTISGLRVSSAGSSQGLFRFIQPEGTVQDLNVRGTVAPEGTRSTVGGIVGDNSGTVRNCTFQGSVQGKSMVGGIAGRNALEGQIVSCSASGSVTGESATGGIAGRSLGVLLECENQAGVNLTDSEPDANLLDVDAESVLTGSAGDDDTYHLLGSCTDTGGIVGYSSGVVQSCTNTGAVGYPHVGYNTGGIAGRQNGYISGCANTGVICGRKDVGGIVGQAEPYVLLDPASDTLELLRGELDALDTLTAQALDNARRTGDSVSARLEAIGSFTGSARDSSQQMLSNVSDFADGNIAAVDTITADLTHALETISPALEQLSGVGSQLEELSNHIWDALGTLDEALDTGDLAMGDALDALERMRQAGGDLNVASGALQQAADALRRGLLSGSDGEILAALNQLRLSASQLGDAFAAVGAAVKDLHAALQGGADLPPVLEEARTALGAIGPALEAIAASLRQAAGSLPTVRGGWQASQAALRQALAAARESGVHLDEALAALETALGRSGDLSDRLSQALEQMQGAAGGAATIGSLLRGAFDRIGDAVDDLTGDDPVSFTPLGEDFRAASDSLYNSLAGLSGEMEGLNSALAGGSSTLTDDLTAVSRQFHVVSGLLLDALGGLGTAAGDGLDSWIEDTSEEDINATREGKVADCRNTGAVEGDRNVGGAVGAMGIEFDLDPEDDAGNVLNFGKTYETKAVLQNCRNHGAVTGKKDCVGGLVGRMDLGTALDCENYGAVASTGGDYVGGIAGWADANLRSCWAKNTLSGENYVGGVTGWASRLRDCRAIATIKAGKECLGAISGGVETGGILEGNLFVDTGTAGVDGVSYTGKAGPISFEELSQMSGVPLEFTTFRLTLLADGQEVAQIPFRYGEDLSAITLPEVPQRADSYGVWPDFDTSGRGSDITLEALYAPWITLAASEETSGNLSLALAEGRFTREAALHVSSAVQAPLAEDGSYPVAWTITLTGTDLGSGAQVPLRLLDTTGGRGEVWQQREGKWQQVEAVRNGQYLMLTMDGTEGTFCIRSAEGNTWLLPATAGAGTAVLAVALLLAVQKLHRRRKKRRAEAEADQ